MRMAVPNHTQRTKDKAANFENGRTARFRSFISRRKIPDATPKNKIIKAR
jgi:hypothetical protein